jgi:hypothetical protein
MLHINYLNPNSADILKSEKVRRFRHWNYAFFCIFMPV